MSEYRECSRQVLSQEIADLVWAMGGAGEDQLVSALCEAARSDLERRLRPGVTTEHCGPAFPVAAAWLVLECLQAGGGDITAFTAGDLSVRTGAQAGGLRAQAERLMAPYCREEGFAFQGVRG